MLSDTILKYKNHYLKHNLYRIEDDYVINTYTKEKYKIPFAKLPFNKYIMYNGLTDEFYIYTICYIATENSEKKRYGLVTEKYAELFYMFYKLPDFKFIGFGKPSELQERNAFLPINNTVIRHVNNHSDYVNSLGNIPVTDLYGLRNFAGEDVFGKSFRSTVTYGVYNNVFIVKPHDKECFIIALVDLKQKPYFFLNKVPKHSIIFNVLV